MNNVSLLGRLTKDPEMKRIEGNNTTTTIAKYTLAVNREFKREGEAEADFIPCVVFGKPAEFAEKWLKKGQQIGVIGRIQTRNYEKDGQKVYVTEIVVEKQFFAESKKDGNSDNNQKSTGKSDKKNPPPTTPGYEIPNEDDDLPF